jgi:hypothetical protein
VNICVYIPKGLNETQLNAFLRQNGIPSNIEDMPIFDIVSKKEFFGPKFSTLFPPDTYGVREDLANRIRDSFSIPFDARYGSSHVSHVPSSLFTQHYKTYRSSLSDADGIVYYSDIPCVILHERTQSSTHWDQYSFWSWAGDKRCCCGHVDFERSKEETQRRVKAVQAAIRAKEEARLVERRAEEKARLGKHRFAILEEARKAAQEKMANIPRSTRNPVGYVSVVSELGNEGIHNLPRGGGPPEMPILEAGAEAFCKVLKKYGIKYNIQTVLD